MGPGSQHTGDQEVDDALRALPSLTAQEADTSAVAAMSDVELDGHIETVTAVHQRLQQRLSDLSK